MEKKDQKPAGFSFPGKEINLVWKIKPSYRDVTAIYKKIDYREAGKL